MHPYILSCCSIVDLTPERLAQRDVIFAPFHFTLNGVEHTDDMGISLSSNDFYQSMYDGATVSTSQVNVEEYLQYFRPYLEDGNDILHLALSSGLSGSFNSARIAAAMNFRSVKFTLSILWAPLPVPVYWWTPWPICAIAGQPSTKPIIGSKKINLSCITGSQLAI